MFFYLMKDEPERVRGAVPRHVAHWRELQLAGYLGGPFADRTGGLITFEIDESGQAKRAVETDPFLEEGLLDAYWLNELGSRARLMGEKDGSGEHTIGTADATCVLHRRSRCRISYIAIEYSLLRYRMRASIATTVTAQ